MASNPDNLCYIRRLKSNIQELDNIAKFFKNEYLKKLESKDFRPDRKMNDLLSTHLDTLDELRWELLNGPYSKCEEFEDRGKAIFGKEDKVDVKVEQTRNEVERLRPVGLPPRSYNDDNDSGIESD